MKNYNDRILNFPRKENTAVFWKNDVKKITVLNPQDFLEPSFLSIIHKHGLSIDLGICDEQETKARLEFMRVLSDEKVRRQLIENAKFFSSIKELPRSENEFLYQYQERQPYWLKLKETVNILKPFTINSSRVHLFLSKLNEMSDTEKVEEVFASDIIHKLKNVTFLEGFISFKLTAKPHFFKFEDNVIHEVTVGKKSYNAAWYEDFKGKIPAFAKNRVAEILRIKKGFQLLSNSITKFKASHSAMVTRTPSCIVKDIYESVYNMLNNGSFAEHPYRNYTFNVYYSYDSRGLKFNVLTVSSHNTSNFKFIHEQNSNLSSKERFKIAHNSKTIRQQYDLYDSIKTMRKEYGEFEEKCSLFSKTHRIENSLADEQFRWYALGHIYNENQEIVKKIKMHRYFMADNMKQIFSLAMIYEEMIAIAIKKNFDICVPSILPANSGTKFENLAPIEIYDKTEKLVPFTLPTINGHIVCLTGRHGGGKSVAGKSILSAVWLAQSGLPIFAKEFKTEIKSVIGSIVNDSGEGSTATVFVEKVKVLLAGMKKVKKGESIVFIDEIGKGTQQTSGINLGKRILQTVSKNGYSTIFNSQIMELAEYAKNDLGAHCFRVDKYHNFVEGIGDGQMNELIKEKGLEKLLD